jgi:hypothetical protein
MQDRCAETKVTLIIAAIFLVIGLAGQWLGWWQ